MVKLPIFTHLRRHARQVGPYNSLGVTINTAVTFSTKKLEWWRNQMVKKVRGSVLVSAQFTNVANGWTNIDTRSRTAETARLHIGAWQN